EDADAGERARADLVIALHVGPATTRDPLDVGAHDLRVFAETRSARRGFCRSAGQLRHRGRGQEVTPGRRLEVPDRASRSDVNVANDLVHRANRGTGPAGGGEARLDVGEIVPRDPGRDEPVGRGAVLQARGAG